MTTEFPVNYLTVLAAVSGSIYSVGYNQNKKTLYVTWQSNPDFIYQYTGATVEDFNDAAKRGVGSVRRNVLAVTSRRHIRPLQRVQGKLKVVLPEVEEKKAGASQFTVTLEANGTFNVKVNAEDFSDAAAKVAKIFTESLVEGTATVKAVKKD